MPIDTFQPVLSFFFGLQNNPNSDSTTKAMENKTLPSGQSKKWIGRTSTRNLLSIAAFCLVWTATASLFAQSDSAAPKAAETAKPQQLTPEERAHIKRTREHKELENKVQRQMRFGALPTNEDTPQSQAYLDAFSRFRKALTEIDQVQYRQQLTKEFTQEINAKLTKEWTDAMAEGNAAYEAWLLTAANLIEKDPARYSVVADTMREMMMHDIALDRFDGWLPVAKALFKGRKPDDYEFLITAGLIGFANNDFDFTKECWEIVGKESQLPLFGSEYLAQVDFLKEKWQRELEFRKQEAEKNDNPQVEFVTSKGRIVVELFEDSAPEAVANLVYLVENGFYKKLPFYCVMQHRFAQTGSEKGDGSGNAGYTIKGEANTTNHRDHFRGSIAVALAVESGTDKTAPDSGGTQFYFSFMPFPERDGNYTVFGRIIEGQATLSMFRVMNLTSEEERKDKSNRPDIIQSASVLRKRDHEYRPDVYTGRLPR